MLHVQAFSFRFLNTLLSLLLFSGALKQTQFPSVGRLHLCHRRPYNMYPREYPTSFRRQLSTTIIEGFRPFFSFFFLFIYSLIPPNHRRLHL